MPSPALRTVLITGGSNGIGRAAVLAFAAAGYNVAFTGRRKEAGEQTARLAADRGHTTRFIQADAATDAGAKAAVDAALSLSGKLDAAFNNAGVEGSLGPITEQSEENYDNIFNTNVRGVFLAMKHQIRAMLASGGGAIVNNASVAGSVGFPGAAIYSASKHAVIGLTRSAALEFAKSGVRINTVSPAAIQTEMFDRFSGSDEGRAAIAAMHPVGRVGTPDEIAAVALFLCSPQASFITGADYRADGGLTAQ